MLKKIIKLFIILFLFFGIKVYSDFIVCDSGNINYDGENITEICNGGYENIDISIIESFTGSYINFDLGFWGSNNNLDLEKNIFENFPVGFFDANKETIIKRVNPEFSNSIGFMGSNYLNTGIITDIENNFPVGFFDINKKTKILKQNLDYSFPVGYLGNYKIKKKSSGNYIPVIKNISYRDFFYDIFKENINPKFLGKYSKHEIDLFINNILDLALKSDKESEKIISEAIKNRIKLYITNSDFKESLNKLINNIDSINNAFNLLKNLKQKFYVIEYYLD